MGLINKIEEKLSSSNNKSSNVNNQQTDPTRTATSERPAHASEIHTTNTNGAAHAAHQSSQASNLASRTTVDDSFETSNVHPALRSDNTQVTDFGNVQHATSTGPNSGLAWFDAGSGAVPQSSGVGNTQHVPGSNNAHGSSTSHGLSENVHPNSHSTHNPITSDGLSGVNGAHSHSTSANPLAGTQNSYVGSGPHDLPGSNNGFQNSHIAHGSTGSEAIAATPHNSISEPNTLHSSHSRDTITTHTGGIPGFEHSHEPHTAASHAHHGNVLSGNNNSHQEGLPGMHTSTHDNATTHNETAHSAQTAVKSSGPKENYDAIPEAGGLKVGSGPFEHDRSYNPAASGKSHGHSRTGTEHAASQVARQITHPTGQHNFSHEQSHNGLARDQTHSTTGHTQPTTGLSHDRNNTLGNTVGEKPLHTETNSHNVSILGENNHSTGTAGTSSPNTYSQSMAQHQADQMMR